MHSADTKAPQSDSIELSEEFKDTSFTQVPNLILRCPLLSNSEKVLYSLLLSHTWGNKTTCFPGQKRLASYMDVTVRRIRQILKRLEIIKLITIHQPGLNKTNRYVIHPLPSWVK